MFKRLYLAIVFLLLAVIPAGAQNFPAPSNSSFPFNISITTATTILSYEGNRLGWTIHPENGNIRCTFGNVYGSTPSNPTSSSGTELTSGGYFGSFPITNPSGIVICIPETGTVTVSGLKDYQ